MPFFPDWVIVTRCVPGCRSRVSWDYDDGEPTTRDYPGYPPTIWAASGCFFEHLDALMEHPEHASIRHDAWQRVADYDRLIGQAHLSAISSLQYIAGPGELVTLDHTPRLGGRPRRQIRVPVRPVWDHHDDDALPF